MTTAFDMTDEQRQQATRDAILRVYGRRPGDPGVTQFMAAQLLDSLPKFTLMLPQLPYIGHLVSSAVQGREPESIEQWPVTHMAHDAARVVTNFVDKATGLRQMGVDRDNPQTYPKSTEYAAYVGNALLPLSIASKAAQSSSALIRGLGKTAEIALPTTAKYTPLNVAVNAGVPVAAAEAGKYLEHTLTEQSKQRTASDALLQGAQIEDHGPVQTASQDALSPELAGAEVTDITPQVHDEELSDKLDRMTQSDHAMRNAVIGLGTAAAAYLALRRGKPLPKFTTVGTGATPKSAFTHLEQAASNPLTQAAHKIADSAREFTDDTQRVTQTIGKLSKQAGYTPDEVAAIKDAVDTRQAMSTRYSMNEKVNDFLETGQFPESSRSTMSYSALRRAVDAQPTDVRNAIGEVLNAGDKLDDLARRGLDDPTLRAIWVRGLNDPKVAPFVNAHRKIVADTLDYIHEKQGIDSAMLQQLRIAHPNFVHRIDAQQAALRESPMHQMATALDSDFRTASRGHETANLWSPRDLASPIDNVVHPVESLEPYLRNTVSELLTQGVRRDMVDELYRRQWQAGRQIIVPAKQLPDGNIRLADGSTAAKGDLTVEFRRNGKVESHVVHNVALAHAMQYAPRVARNVVEASLNVVRKTAQDMTTLPLVNPMLAVLRAPLLDAHIATTLKDTRLNYGIVDEVTRRVFGTAANFPDPVVHLQSAHAVLYNSYMEFARLAQQAVSRAVIDRTSVLGKLYADPATRPWVENTVGRVANSYMKSVYRMLRSEGAMSTRTHMQGSGPVRTVIGQVPVAHELLHVSDVIADIVQSAHQTAVALQNVHRIDELGGRENFLKLIKGLYGDYARQGSGAVSRVVSTTVPWANLSMRTMYKLGSQLRHSPMQTLVGVFSVALAQIASELMWQTKSAAHAKYFDENVSEADKLNSVFVPLSDDPHDHVRIPLEPTTLPLVNAATDGLKYMFAIDNLQWHDMHTDAHMWRTQQAFLTMLGQFVNYPIMQHYLASQGVHVDTGTFGDENAIYKIEPSSSVLRDPMDIDKRYMQGQVSKFTWNLVEDVFTVVGRLGLETTEGFHDAGVKGALNEFAHAYTKTAVLPQSPKLNTDYVKEISRVKQDVNALRLWYKAGMQEPQEALSKADMIVGTPDHIGKIPRGLRTDAQVKAGLAYEAISKYVDDALANYDVARTEYDSIVSKRGSPHEREVRLRTVVPQINAYAHEAIELIREFERKYGRISDLVTQAVK